MLSPACPLLEIECGKRSHRVVTAATVLILALVPWVLPGQSALAAIFLAGTACVIATISFWSLGWLGGDRAVHRAVWAANGDWRIVDWGGLSYPATLLPASRVLGAVVWLRFMSERGPRGLLLIGSELESDVHRRLVSRLRLQACQRNPSAIEPTVANLGGKGQP